MAQLSELEPPAPAAPAVDIPESPPTKGEIRTEESIPLRVLVQALVSIGIVATDIAAVDVTGAWQVTSYWAVPMGIVGATLSYRQRRKRNIATKFAIAIGMLVSLVLFFGRLIGELNDTRLALAQLLIQLQVLHSFDLPRRKDLGYSMVIGLILLGVAGTLSQTLSFGPFLLLFLAIALPVMVLDYRSRLGLASLDHPSAQWPAAAKAQRWQWSKLMPLTLKQMSVLLGITLLLGLMIFAFLPRLPGYQLRAFPVSPTREYQGEFDATQVINPGYVGRRGEQSQAQNAEGFGTGTRTQQSRGQGRGPGQLDQNQYYGFDSQINQNLRGKLKPQIVMRVRSQAEGFWRVMGFDQYTGHGWEVSRNEQSTTVDRNPWNFQFELPRPITINRTREVVQTYTIVAEELPNMIPALAHPRTLFFPTRQVAVDTEGALRSPLSLREGDTYTVISDVPYRDRTLLRRAPTSYSDSFRKYYLQVPPEFAAKFRDFTNGVLAKADPPVTDPYEKALYLTQYLKQNYEILPELPFWGDTQDMVDAFLFFYRGGYADHFSTTLTILLRSIGIPARLVTGFGPGQFNAFTGLYVVRNTDAYAITEVFFPKYGWHAFDPIPGHELIPPSIEDFEQFTVLQHFWRWVAGWLPSPIVAFVNRLLEIVGSAIGQLVGWFLGLFTRGWFGFFMGLIVLTALGFFGWLVWNGIHLWIYRQWLAKLSPIQRLYQQMLDWLTLQGYRKSLADTPLEFARRVQSHYGPEESQIIQEITVAYTRWRYGGYGVSASQVSDLTKRWQAWKKQAREGLKPAKHRSLAISSSS